MNKNVYLSEQVEGLFFKVPSVTVGGGGGTIAINKEVFQLNPAAKVAVNSKTKQCINAVYRIEIPYNECAIAAENESYFNYLFDAVMNQAIPNYNATFGGSDKLRWGNYYCQAFSDTQQALNDTSDEYVELRLAGFWASDKDADTITLPTEMADNNA
jgi:hypothetical protein